MKNVEEMCVPFDSDKTFASCCVHALKFLKCYHCISISGIAAHTVVLYNNLPLLKHFKLFLPSLQMELNLNVLKVISS